MNDPASLLTFLTKKEAWQEFFLERTAHGRLTKREEARLAAYIEEERFPKDISGITFGIPEKKLLAKTDSTKKRTVYTFSEEENFLLKHLAQRLHRYDACLPDGCYAFRRHVSAKTAVDRILAVPGLDRKYILKADISNYFNSIDVPLLLSDLGAVITDDPALLALLRDLLTKDRCIFRGEIIEEKRGAMAGVPLAGFFANLYLTGLDRLFAAKGIPCFRYSDDILLIADTEEERERCFALLEAYIGERRLALNPDKVRLPKPGGGWDFLGFRIRNGQVDLADGAIAKLEGKIRRKAARLRVKMVREGLPYQKAAALMIRYFDQKLYDLTGDDAFTWTRFYFPVLTTDEGLRRIDAYMLMYLRFLSTGRHTKRNYSVRYDALKRLGYTPLAAEYHRWRAEERKWDT